MKVLFAVFNLGFLLFLAIWIWRTDKSSLRKYFWPALILKCCAGISLGLIYTYYYTTGDTLNYFEDGITLAHLARADWASYLKFLWSGDESFPVWSELLFQQPRALFLSKITSIFCLLTHDDYWITSLYFSTIAFASAWWLVKKISTMDASAERPASIGFLFFPSVVFWSSGIIKESLAMAALFFLSFVFLKSWKKGALHLSLWLLTFFSLWLLWNLKYYYLAVFLPVILTTLAVLFLLAKFEIRNVLLNYVLWCVIFCIPLILVSLLHPNFYVDRFMSVVVSNYHQFHAISNPEDVIHYNSLQATPFSILQNIPWALFSGLFRPFVTEANSLLQVFIALENLVLLILFVFALPGLRRLSTNRHFIIFSIIIYCFLLCAFLALSTPNFGTLSRYRVGFLPFFVFLITIKNPLVDKIVCLGTNIFHRLVR